MASKPVDPTVNDHRAIMMGNMDQSLISLILDINQPTLVAWAVEFSSPKRSSKLRGSLSP